MGWEGGSGWGTHVNPWLIHVNVWQKPLEYCKVISLQLIKIIGKKKGGRDFQDWATTHFLAFCGQPENCYCACVCHLAKALQRTHNEAHGQLEVQSSAILGLISFNKLCFIL